MKQLGIACLILLWAAPSVAAPVLVRSGEHGAFTRIVIHADPSTDWQLRQNGRVATLELPGNGDGFLTSSVFPRIPRDRLKDVSSDASRLTLELGCECVVSATPQPPGFIILDIAPGTPPVSDAPMDAAVAEAVEAAVAEAVAATEPETPDWSDSIAATERYFGLDDLTAGEGPEIGAPRVDAPDAPADQAAETVPMAPVLLPLVQDPADRRPFDLGGAIPRVPAQPDTATDPESDPATMQRTADSLDVLEDRLARQIGLAATQGLLKPAPDRRRELSRMAEGEAAPEDPPHLPKAPLDPLLNHGGLPGNLRISGSVERPDSAGPALATTLDGLTCADAGLFAVPDWGREGAFGSEIARHRNALYGEFDALDREAQIALARAYIYYGFGAEALQIAALDIRNEQVDAAIMVMGRLMEYGPGPRTDRFSRFAECDSDVALWAILADSGTGQPERMNTAAALRALNKLPYHLRSFLAPELSKRLRRYGDADAAAHAMRSLSRTPHAPESPAKLEQAEIDLATGDDKKASDGFESVIEDNSFEAPRALIRFIDLQVANGEAISRDTALLAEAYAAEYRNSDLAPEITRAHMMALAKSGQFDAAFGILASARSLRMDTGSLITGLYDTLRSDADNVTFLKRTLALSETELAQISERTRLFLGERLLDLGFSAQAEEVISQVDRHVAPREQLLLRGRLHLAMGNHRQALAAAGTFSGPDFDALRADALYASGQFAEAAEIYEALGDLDRAETAAWKAPTGSVPARPEDSSLMRAADLAERPVPEAEGGLLAKAGALLSDSSALGADIEALLANPELNIGPDN